MRMGSFNPLDYPISLSQPERLPDDPAALNWIEHVPFAMALVDIVRPRVIVELGTHTGVSYCAFCQAVATLGSATRCFAIDTWQGDEQSEFYGPEVLADLRAHHDPRYSGFSRLVESTFDEAVGQFAAGSIDLLHIDGYHTYEAVEHDFKTWLPKLSDRAVVLLHDTSVRKPGFGVWQLWRELAARYPHLEFSHGNGLGLLVVNAFPSDILRELTGSPDDATNRLRAYFHQLGQRLATQFALRQTRATLRGQLAEKNQQIANRDAALADRDWQIATIRQELEQAASAAIHRRVLRRLQALEARLSRQPRQQARNVHTPVAAPHTGPGRAWAEARRRVRAILPGATGHDEDTR